MDASTVSYLSVLKRIPNVQLTIAGTGPITNQMVDSSDLVFCLREIRGQFAQILQRAKVRKIRTAYATDDNFIEYAKVNPAYRGFWDPHVLETLRNVNYIFCSNRNLCNYYQNLSNHKTWLWPANAPAGKIPLKSNPATGKIVLGFFGNARGEVFQTVAGSLKKVQALRPRVAIFSAGTDLRPYGVRSTYIPFTPNYKTAIKNIRKLKPHILIGPNGDHFSPNVPNTNLNYKCIAKLVDATRLGAVLVASKLGPFADKGERQGVLTVPNTEAAWTAALLRVVDNGRLRARLFHNARNYLLKHHESSKIAHKIGRIIKKKG